MEERGPSDVSNGSSDHRNVVKNATSSIFSHGQKADQDSDPKSVRTDSDLKSDRPDFDQKWDYPDSAQKSDHPDSDHKDSAERESSELWEERTTDTTAARTPKAGVCIVSEKPASSVSPSAAQHGGSKRVSSSKLHMERELERMRQAEENARARERVRRRREVQRAVAAMQAQRHTAGLTMTPDVEQSRAAIRSMMREEERMALEKDQKRLRQETKALQQAINEKYGLKDKKQGPDLLALAESFYHGKVKDGDGLPEKVRRELTKKEIEDLKMVFDMFDVKGRGYITANDVKRAASMLGFKAKKQVFKDMIGEVTGEKTGRVSFVHFLQFVVIGQGDGDDPLEDIMQGFRMLDSDQKGYLTADDLRKAADGQKLPFSNRAIREMVEEADVTGDGKVMADEFIHIMLQTSMFRTTR